jgi:ABC-2 type transport system permease protein
MSAHAGTAPRTSASLETRLRATARSEWIKFRSVRSSPAVLLATAVILPVTAWLLCAYYRNNWATMSPASKASFDPVFISLRGIEGAQLFAGALGVITATGEYTSGLIRSTFIATPQRAQVIAMKAMIFAAVVWAWCTLLSFAAFFIGQALLPSPAKHVAIGDPGVLTAAFGGGLYLTAVGLLGLFIGVLLRRTPAALAALFGILLVLPVAVGLLGGKIGAQLAEFLPDSGGEEIFKLLHGGAYTLGPWPGFAVLAAYVAAAAAAAFWLCGLPLLLSVGNSQRPNGYIRRIVGML